MDINEAAKRLPRVLVRDARRGFPGVYSAFIQGRWREFIAEHAPKERVEAEGEEILGPLPLSLKMLWALAVFFDDNCGYDKWPESTEGYTAEEVCLHLQRVNMWNFSNLLHHAFWQEVRHMFPDRKQEGRMLLLRPDYSVASLPRNGKDLLTKFQTFAQISYGIVRCNSGIAIAVDIGFRDSDQK